MYSVLVVIHIIVSIFLVLLVLIQTGRGGGFGGIFGGGAEQLLSTPSGSATIRRLTAVVAGVFFLTSLAITISASRRSIRSVTSSIPVQSQPAPNPAPPEK